MCHGGWWPASCWLTGCQHFQIPAIDPTGERIFSSFGPDAVGHPERFAVSRRPGCLFPKTGVEPSGHAAALSGTAATGSAARRQRLWCTHAATIQPRPVQRGIPGKIMVNPTRLIAPVGSEVVLVGGLCGDDGYLITCQKIEWSLSQDSVGQIVDFSDRGGYWYASKKLERGLRDYQDIPSQRDRHARHAERDGRHRAAEGPMLDQLHVGQRRHQLRDGLGAGRCHLAAAAAGGHDSTGSTASGRFPIRWPCRPVKDTRFPRT